MQQAGAYQNRLRKLDRDRRNRDGLSKLIDLAWATNQPAGARCSPPDAPPNRLGDSQTTALGGPRFYSTTEWWKLRDRPPPLETTKPASGNGAKPKAPAGLERLAKALAGSQSCPDSPQRDNGGILSFSLFSLLNGVGIQDSPLASTNHNNTIHPPFATLNGKVNPDFTKREELPAETDYQERRDQAVPCRVQLIALNLQAMLQSLTLGDAGEARQLLEDCLQDVRALRAWDVPARQIYDDVLGELARPVQLPLL